MSTPYIGFGNDTLQSLPAIKEGDIIVCDRCGATHSLVASKPPLLLFYSCGGKDYLAALNGRDVRNRKADCSGQL